MGRPKRESEERPSERWGEAGGESSLWKAKNQGELPGSRKPNEGHDGALGNLTGRERFSPASVLSHSSGGFSCSYRAGTSAAPSWPSLFIQVLQA